MAEKLVWLQVDTFPIERKQRDFLMRQVWVSIPTMSQCGHPLCDTAGKVQGTLMAELLRKKRRDFMSQLLSGSGKQNLNGSQQGAMTSSPALLLKVAESVTKNK